MNFWLKRLEGMVVVRRGQTQELLLAAARGHGDRDGLRTGG